MKAPSSVALGLIASLLFLNTTHATAPDSDPRTSGIATQYFDSEVRPQDDFYRFVNGKWLEETQIPPDRSNYGAFVELDVKAKEDLRAIIKEAVADTDAPRGSDTRKVADFYRSFMDTVAVERRGTSPLTEDLERIDQISSYEELAQYVAHAQRYMGAPFNYYINQDLKNATQYTVYVTQTGLGLPNRQYYFDDQFEEARAKYQWYVQRLHELAGLPGGDAAAQTVYGIEKRLAEKHWTPVQNRDRNATYNKFAVADLGTLAPGFDWNEWLAAADIDIDSLVVRQPDYLTFVGETVMEVPLEDWKTYFRHRAINSAAAYLPQDFVDARFDMYGRTLSGAEEMRPRWKRAVTATEGALGEVLGRLYVDRHFDQESKQRMDELVENLRRAFRQAINELEWMSEPTKVQALDKLEKFTPKVGYPDKWKDYSDLTVRADDLYGNVRRSNEVEHEREMAKLGQPVDRDEWFMTPQTVNAYYNPAMNEVVFPAAILQPPFFNPEADAAVNYGAIGGVIGHEFSHGFDDQGRKSDGDGNLRDWWTEADAQEFQKRSEGLIAQYNAYSPIEGMHVDGELTLGENIGDLAGLTMAYRAYKLSLNGEEAPVIDGLTGDQRFFMGWAQVWRRLYRDATLKERLVADPHSPSQYRTNGIVSNMPAFYEAFDVQPGDGMYIEPEKRVKVW